jgi:TonB family protein
MRKLQQFKHTRPARPDTEQGVALLAFSVNRDGHVLDRQIVRSSGHAELDNEILAMIERAQPRPAFPLSMHEQKSLPAATLVPRPSIRATTGESFAVCPGIADRTNMSAPGTSRQCAAHGHVGNWGYERMCRR